MQLDALNRFAEIMESLCAVGVARLAPRTFLGRVFGGFSWPLLSRISGELRGVSNAVRAFAAGIAAGVPLLPPASCDDVLNRDALGCLDGEADDEAADVFSCR